MFGRQAGQAIDIVLRAFERILHPATHTKDLSHLVPLAGQKVIEFGRDLNQPAGSTPMLFVSSAAGAPIYTIERCFVEKEAQIFLQGWLVAFHKEQITASRRNDLLAELP